MLAAAAAAQTGSTPVPGVFNGITLALAQPPQPVSSATGVVQGNPGPRILYYWIVTNALIGSSAPAGPFIVPLAPNTLTASNSVSLSWAAAPGAITYDVLRTTSPAAPVGACNCAVATAIAGTTASDQSNTLGAYTVAQFDPNTLAWTLSNQSAAAGVSKLSLSVAGQQKWSIDSTGVQTYVGLNAKTIEAVRYADQFPGADVGAQVNAAIADCPASGCTVVIPAGSYIFSTTITLNKTVSLRGAGVAATVLSYTGTSDALLVEAGGNYPYLNGRLTGMTISGASDSNANINGIHHVDTIGFTYDHLAVRDFSTAGSSGIWMDNEPAAYCANCASGFSERTTIGKVSLAQNTKGLRFTCACTTGATNSFEYTWIRGLHFQLNNGQIGFSLEGNGSTSNSPALQHSDVQFMANLFYAQQAGTPATVVSVTNGAEWFQGFVHATAELTFGNSGTFWSVNGGFVDAWGEVVSSGTTNSVSGGGYLQLGIYGPTYVIASNANGQVGTGGFNSTSLTAPLAIGGNTNSAVAGFYDLDLAGSFAAGGQLNETIEMGGDAGAVGGIGFDLGSSIQHPISWSYIGDTTAWAWYSKTNPTSPIVSGNLGAWLTGPASGSPWQFAAKSFASTSTNVAQSGAFRMANADFLAWRNAGNTADITLGPPATSGNAATTSQLPLAATTASIGGAALAAGACTTGTVAVTGATTAMVASTSPAADPGAGFDWQALVGPAGTVTVRVCNRTTGSLTPTSEIYNVRVIQ